MSDITELGEHLEGYVAALVRSGRFGSRDQVLREGVRLLEEMDKRADLVDAALQRGLADADANRVRPAGEVAKRLTAKYEDLAQAHAE